MTDPAGFIRSISPNDRSVLYNLFSVGMDPVQIGKLCPTLDAQDNLSASVRVDKRITGALNVPSARLESAGKVNNSANIGKPTGSRIPSELAKLATPCL